MPNYKEEFEKCAAENKKLKDKVRSIQTTLGLERERIEKLTFENEELKESLKLEKDDNKGLFVLGLCAALVAFFLVLKNAFQ